MAKLKELKRAAEEFSGGRTGLVTMDNMLTIHGMVMESSVGRMVQYMMGLYCGICAMVLERSAGLMVRSVTKPRITGYTESNFMSVTYDRVFQR